MANLQLNIEVNDEEFKDICSNNIKDLPKDKLNELLLKAMEVALISDKENPYYDKNSNILVNRVEYRNSWGSEYKYEPTDMLKEIIKKVDLTEYIGNMADTVRNYIENNYEEIIKEYVVESFANMIFSRDRAYELRNALVSDVNSMLERNRGY